jgi:peptide/nickel transport system ATP-binding protein
MSASGKKIHDGVAAVGGDLRDCGGPGTSLLSVRGLIKHFGRKAGRLTKAGAMVRAVDGVDFDVAKGETLGIVGESGCGKSTTARLIMQIIKPDAGDILFDGEAVGSSALDLTAFRKQTQMVFQDSYASLNPRLTVEDTVAFGPRVHGASRRAAGSSRHASPGVTRTKFRAGNGSASTSPAALRSSHGS